MKYRDQIVRFLTALIDQQAARVLVEPQERGPGFWFGGGNAIKVDGEELLVMGESEILAVLED